MFHFTNEQREAVANLGGTIGTEINRQLKDIHAVFVAVGGGGLIAGVATYLKKVAPNTEIIEVEPFGASSMTLSLHHGERIKLEHVDNFADGVAVALGVEETFRLCNGCSFMPEEPGSFKKNSTNRFLINGELDASVLVGFQVPKSEMDEFQNQANNLGYSYEIESLNEASKLIIE
ncbi:hypothetical protein RND71_038905 [Anisodus tanguticus]|uniref:threonine ammonia-lyase n=1 Tax=Anisodus tanguticus TaxID=243964 RepID=A0AAE1UZK3_9SOLA|nr:hypothetical protein RND71_038905 [Anisodus tanguticus]